MKNLITTAAMLVAIACPAWAQTNDNDHKPPPVPSATESNFNMPENYLNIRDYVYLPGKAKMVIELNNVAQYNELKGIDTILTAFMRGIAFYKDSLVTDGGSVRIDYVVDDEFQINKIRFKRYMADGDIFMSRRGDKSRLKLEQDTVHIYIKHYPQVAGKAPNKRWENEYMKRFTNSQLCQITFYVNSYEDIARIAADKQTMQHAIDTLIATKRASTVMNPSKWPSSARYNPYASQPDANRKWWATADVRFKQYGGLVQSDMQRSWLAIRRSDMLTIDGNIGASLVRSTMAPYGELGLSFTKQGPRAYRGEYLKIIVRAYASANFFFEKNAAGDYLAKSNWFVNADIGEAKDINMGIGYLIRAQGDYFKGTTMKAFFNIRLLNTGLTLCPELIFTNNFGQIFPGLTIKAL